MTGFWNRLLPDLSVTNTEVVAAFSGRQCEML